MKAKEKHKINLLKYLGDPEKDFPVRSKYPEFLSISRNTMYVHFTPDELCKIESEAVELRKQRSGRQRANILTALYEKSIGYVFPEETKIKINEKGKTSVIEITKRLPPDKAAAQEFLDRTEGKVPDKVHLGGPGGEPLKPILNINMGKK